MTKLLLSKMIALVLLLAVLTTSVTCQSKTRGKDICPKNQRWVPCELGFCAPKKCDDLGYPIACPDFWGPCPGGCICKEGYLKNRKDVCIPQEQCPSCGGDYNATSGDGYHCGNLCSNYFEKKSKFNACRKQVTQYNACRCKKGFVYDDIIRQCVAPQDCPKPCNGDYYAEPKSCPSSCQPTCAYPKDPEVCTDDCNRNECVCRDGYILKERNGKCVKIEECPGDLGCDGDPNAIITSCGGCPPTCEQLNKEEEPIFCAAVCIPRSCTCKPSYIYSNKQGKCILESECKRSA